MSGLSASLPRYLRSNVVVRQAGGGEEWDLLATGDGVHAVDRRDARLDHLLGVRAHLRVDGLAVDVEEVLGQHRRAFVNRLARAVEDAAKHVLGDGRGEDVAGELDRRAKGINARRALEDLDDGLGALHLQHLACARAAVGERQVDDLGELWRADVLWAERAGCSRRSAGTSGLGRCSARQAANCAGGD